MKNGVEYNNKGLHKIINDNIFATKDDPAPSVIPSGKINDFGFDPMTGVLPSGNHIVAAPTPILDRSMVERCVISLFDNGEQSKQRYKLTIRLNLKDEAQSNSPEFIAPMSKDPRSFRRYSPVGTREELVDFHNEIRKYVKGQGIDNKPYFGKLHLNNENWELGRKSIQVEPLCFASVWYDGEGWSGIIKMYDFLLPFDLFSDHLTAKQKSMNVKSTYLWLNPKYQKSRRPLTWAERRKK
jgi:hypothetical protein